MNKANKIISAVVIAACVFMIPVITNTLSAASATFGPYGAFSVYAKNDVTINNSTIEGRLAVGNNLNVESDAKIATGYNPQTVVGYFLENSEYPSVVVNNQTKLNDLTYITDGDLYTQTVNNQDQLRLEGESAVVNTELGTELTEGFEHFDQQAQNLITNLFSLKADLDDQSSVQVIPTYYEQEDKSLLLTELSGKPVTTEAGQIQVVNIDKIEIEKLLGHEKLIIRSEADHININDAEIFYENQKIDVDMLDNPDANVESLANNIVWFFPNAKQVNLDNSDVIGTIIAPKADLEITDSIVAGQILANNIKQTNAYIVNRVSFIHDYDFNRNPNNTTFTVEYIDEQGNELAEPKTLTREIGTTVNSDLPEIEGYQVSNQAAVDTLTEGVVIEEKNQVYSVGYSVLFNATLTVNHLFENGTDIIPPEETLYDIGEAYTTSPLDDPQYALIETPANASGIMEEAVTVTYVYADADNITELTIRHVDETGVDLIASETDLVVTNSNYDVSSYIINNRIYKYTGLYSGSAPISGIADRNKTIILKYAPEQVCANYTPSNNLDIGYALGGKNRVLKNEVEYNRIKTTGLIEEQLNTESDPLMVDFGLGYTSATTNPTFIDYKYSLDTGSDYGQYIPIRQTGDFAPIDVVISSEGNSYDLRSRGDTKSLANYQLGGINYQGMIGLGGNKSLNIHFDKCSATVSFNNGVSSRNGTEIMTYDYVDFEYLDESFAGYSFDWDATTKNILITIMFEKNGEINYSENSFAIDLSSYNFAPKDFSLAYQNSANTTTTSYLPYVLGDRHYYNVIGLESPYVDTTNKRYTVEEAMANNEIYEIYALNGDVQFANKLTQKSSIKSYTLPYNPKGYTKMISTDFPRSDKNIYGYLVGGSYTTSSGLKLMAENPVIYAKNIHPRYSTTVDTGTVTLFESVYSSLNDVEIGFNTLLFRDGENITSGDAIDNITQVIVDESNVNFDAKGNYTAFGFVKTRDETSGEFINSKTNINVTVSGAILDYGDAPSSYGPAGAKVGDSKYRFNIGINRNGNRETHADAESSPRYSSDARGDDITGMSDETGWFNMDTNGIGELNVEMEKVRVSFPYSATGNGAVAFWIDYNQNGKFEDFEGQIKSVNASPYTGYGVVNFDLDLTQSFSTLEAGDSTYARVRILSSKQNLTTAASATTFDGYYGETEDFVVNLFGKKNEYQICTQVLANTPIVTVKNVSPVTKAGPNGDESGVKYVFDIGDPNPNSNSSNSFYPDVQVTVTSKQGIVSNTKGGEPAFFRVEQSTSPYERPANTIRISTRNKDGQPINLPLTFSFWDLDDFTGSTVIESVSLDKNSVYLEGLEASDVKLTNDTVGVVEDYGTYLKLFASKQVESEPEATFLLQGTSLARSDIEIVEEARMIEIGLGLDLGQMDKVIADCVEPYEPKAQIQIFDQFYDNEVSIYNNYPFAYQSTNIPFPYFSNFNSVTQNLYIPEGVEFVNGDTNVTIYRRNFLGPRRESDWQVVDSSLYTQVLDLENNISSVQFKDPVGNKIYGYEYRMEYNFEISEEMATGQRIVFKSDFEYNKGKSGEYSETYKLNDVTAIVKEAFTADINTVMNSDTIVVDTDSSSIYYTYEYLNCDSCIGSQDRKLLTGDFDIPIPDSNQLSFYSSSNFDKYEDIELVLYDNDMKVFELPLRRWYPTELEYEVNDIDNVEKIYEDLNPIAQTIQVRAPFKGYAGFDKPVKVGYTGEVLNIKKQKPVNLVEDGILRVDNIVSYITTESLVTVPSSWSPTYWKPITTSDLVPIYDAEEVFVADDDSCIDLECQERDYHMLSIEPSALDMTLETNLIDVNNRTYKSVYFEDVYSIGEDNQVELSSKLDDKYIIEDYSGRIYNQEITEECQSATDNPDGKPFYCSGDEQEFATPTTDIGQILTGFNDQEDGDIQINTVLEDGIPLSEDIETGEKINYLIYLDEFGLNKTNVIVADQLEVVSKPIGYYRNDSSYYFQRDNPTAEEVECIKEGNCPVQYEIVTEGQLQNPGEIQNEISKNPSLLESFKSFNNWLDQYI